MTQSEFVVECRKIFEMNRLPCTQVQAERLYILTKRMLEVNKSINLTAITDEKTVILKHYVDSLTISSSICEGASLIDVGCGAGFPSIPLAIFRPDLRVLSLDGTAKRIAYVTETARELALNNLTAISGRAEELANRAEYRERFDVATARAVASLPVLCELCLPFVKVGGKMIAMKSQRAEEELSLARNSIATCGGSDSTIRMCDLISDAKEKETRCLIFIKKSVSTPRNFPRHFSKISKKPL